MARSSQARAMVRMDPDAARAPIWRGQVKASSETEGYLHGRPCSTHQQSVVTLPAGATNLAKVHGGLTPTDQRLLGEILYRWEHDGCPAHREVRTSLRTLAVALWPDAQFSGERTRLLGESLLRLMAIVVVSARWDDRHGSTKMWHLLEKVEIDRARDRHGRGSQTRCRVSTEVAEAVATGKGTLLPLGIWDALREESEAATILWTWLRSEKFPHGMSWRIFADGDGPVTPVAVRLGLRAAERRTVLRRIRSAAVVVMRHDPTFTLDVVQNDQSGRWTFRASRQAAVASPAGPLSGEVMTAYRAAYGMRRPSASQVEVLLDLMGHLPGESDPAGWVARELRAATEAGHPDPLKAALERGHARQRAAAVATAAREEEWADIKAAESGSNGAEGWLMVGNTLQQMGLVKPLGNE